MTGQAPLVLIPALLWDELLNQFALHAPTVERVAYLDGHVVDHTGYEPKPIPQAIVSTVVFPDAHLTPVNYAVPAAAMRQAGRHLIGWSMIRLAQVHTHGNGQIDHSTTDDRKAYSQRAGAISIVVPHHGRHRPTLHECGVHLRTRDGWLRLAPSEIHRHARLVPSILDFRDQHA